MFYFYRRLAMIRPRRENLAVVNITYPVQLNNKIEKSSIPTRPFPLMSAGGFELPPLVPHQKIKIEKSTKLILLSRFRSEGLVACPSTPTKSCRVVLKLL